MKSILLSRLNEADRRQLGQYCAERYTQLESGMINWRQDRDRWDKQAQDCFESRVASGKDAPDSIDAIFKLSNESLNIVGGFVEYLHARTVDDILGSEPWFSLQPEGTSDKDLASGMQKHSEWKLRRSNLKDAYDAAIAKAYAIGEGVVKLNWERKVQWFEREAEVLVDSSGNPILAPENPDAPDYKRRDFIFRDDGIIATPERQVTNEDGTVTVEPARITIEKYPDVEVPAGAGWQKKIVEDEIVTYDNVSAGVVSYKDFTASLLVSDLEKGGFVAHSYDETWLDAKRRYNIPAELGKIISQEDNAPKTPSELPDSASGETLPPTETSIDLRNPKIRFAECYQDYVINDRPVRLFVVLAVQTQELVWAEYLSLMTPKGGQPFFPVRAFKAANGRWFGRGLFEALEKAQTFIDRQLNYINYRNRFSANPVKGVDFSKLKGIADTNEIVIAPGSSIQLNPDSKLSEAVQVLTFPDLDTRTWQLMEMMIQIIQLRTGVTTAAQGGVGELAQSNTARGVEAIISSGNVLAKLPVMHIKAVLERATDFAIRLVYRNMDTKETFTYLEGTHPELLTISREQVEKLEIDVRILLTRFRQREMRENATIALDAVTRYVSFAPEDRASVRPLIVQIIRGTGFDDAENYVPAVPEPAQQPALPTPAPL